MKWPKDSWITKSHSNLEDISRKLNTSSSPWHNLQAAQPLSGFPFLVFQLVWASSRQPSCFLLSLCSFPGLSFFEATWLLWEAVSFFESDCEVWTAYVFLGREALVGLVSFMDFLKILWFIYFLSLGNFYAICIISFSFRTSYCFTYL